MENKIIMSESTQPNNKSTANLGFFNLLEIYYASLFLVMSCIKKGNTKLNIRCAEILENIYTDYESIYQLSTLKDKILENFEEDFEFSKSLEEELNEFTKTIIKKSYDFKEVSSIYIPKIMQMKRGIEIIKKDKNILEAYNKMIKYINKSFIYNKRI